MTDFIRETIEKDHAAHKHGGRLHTRFPPEPNGYLHLGHAKAISISFGIAIERGGLYNLRFDDTNPLKEEAAFVEAIQQDVRWLGYEVGERVFYASDYFEQLYEWAVLLVKRGPAYVCDLNDAELSEQRGTSSFAADGKRITQPGRNSPYRERSAAENLELLEGMRRGDFPEGSRTLRAKIDMAHPNLNMRDPIMYRIIHAPHHRTGERWHIYPTYDWAHGQSDSIEGITHSLCDTGFEGHRVLYDWYLDALGIHHPQQIEFGRMSLTYNIMSKRLAAELIAAGDVSGWDDPRLCTLRGLRRRGYPPEAINAFCQKIGISRNNATIEVQLLEHCVREHWNQHAARAMAVVDPLKLVITSLPPEAEVRVEAQNNPENPAAGARPLALTRELWIERGDFMEEPPSKYHRLAPGKEVRLRYGAIVRCERAVRGASGEIEEVHCVHDPDSIGGRAADGRTVRGTIHWVSRPGAVRAQARLYDRLFTTEEPARAEPGRSWRDNLNPRSLETVDCYVEPAAARSAPGEVHQFERLGYFCTDTESTPAKPVFNRTVSLRDSWQKLAARGGE
jgi:glutaminyl-tRNA synthetase